MTMRAARLVERRAEMALLFVLVIALRLLPRGLPGGVIGLGVVAGALLSLQAAGVVLLYSRTKILSFAQFGLGAAAAVLFYLWVQYNQWAVLANGVCGCLAPRHASMSLLQHHPDIFRAYLLHHHPWALVVNALISAAIGIALAANTGRQVFVWLAAVFARAPRIVPTIATLALAITLGSAAGLLTLRTTTVFGHQVFAWFPYGPVPGTGLHGHTPLPEGTFSSPALNSISFTLGSGTRFHLYDVITVAAAMLMVAGIALRFERGRRGLASRATAADVERAATLGVDVVRESTTPWKAAGALSGLAGVLTVAIGQAAPTVGLDVASLTLVLAAAVLARMTSVGWAVAASIALGVLQQGMFWNFHSQTQFEAGLVVVVGVALLLQRRRMSRADTAAETVFGTAVEPAAVPERLLRIPGVSVLLRGPQILLGIAVVLYPAATTPSQLSLGITVLAYAVVGLSLLVLSGWGGQVSLAQLSLGAIGGWATAVSAAHAHLPLPIALLVGAAAGGLVAPLLGFPAYRLPGPFVVIMTLAFAIAVPAVFLDPQLLGQYLPADLPRPVILGLDLSSDRYFYWLSLVVLLTTLVVVMGLRRSRLRRALIAARDNPNAAAALGVDIRRLRLEAFAIAGALAGVGGGLLSYANGSVTTDAFSPLISVGLFLIVVIGGLSAISGPMLGAGALSVAQLAGPVWVGLLNGLGTLVVLSRRPSGLASLVVGLRDAAIRVLIHLRGSDLLRFAGFETGIPRIVIADRGAQAPVVPVVYRLVGDGYGPVEGTRLRSVAGFEAAVPTEAAPVDDDRLTDDVEKALTALACHRLDVAYDGVTVLHGVSLRVAPGEVLAVVGLNGAGKTSLLRALAGLEQPSHGTVEILGQDVTQWLPHQRAALGVAFVPGGAGVLPTLTVRENLTIAAETATSYDDALTWFPALRDRLDTAAGNLSGGEQQVLAVAQAMLRKPSVLLIDEVALGLSPQALATVLELIRSAATAGAAVVLVEQNISASMDIADRALFLESGQVRYQGPAQDLREHPELFASIAFGSSSSSAAVSSRSEVTRSQQSIRTERDAVLRVEAISAAYGDVHIVDEVSLCVASGEVIGVIGPNGAGKTSLFDCLSGLLPVIEGTISLHGQDITTLPPHRRASAGLMRSFQSARLFPSLSVRDCIAVAMETRLTVKSPVFAGLWLPPARAQERRVDDRVASLLELLALEKLSEAPVGSLSLGSRRLVDLACQLAARPSVLLLDEPAAGLAQAETEVLGPLLGRISSDLDCAVLVIEHNIQVLASVVDRLVVMSGGRLITDGAPHDVLADPAVTAAYFGGVHPTALEPIA